MTGVKKLKFGKVLIYLREKKNNRKPNPFIKTIVGMSNRHYSEIYQKEIWKAEYTSSSGTTRKMRPPRHLVQLSILKGGLDILHIDILLNSQKLNGFKDYYTPSMLSGKILRCIDWTKYLILKKV